MGWTYTRKEKGQSIKEFFQERFGKEHEILDCAVIRMRTAYMAIKDRTGHVYGAVILLDYRPKDYSYNFGWKDMDESQGPLERECPERILNQLSALPFGSESSLAWRNACWEHIRKVKALPPIRTGSRIITNEPIHFTTGKCSDFVVKDARRLHFVPYPDQYLMRVCKISRKTLRRVGYKLAS